MRTDLIALAVLVSLALIEPGSANPSIRTRAQESPAQAPPTPVRAHCEGLADIVKELERAVVAGEDVSTAKSIDALLDRHAARHGWIGSFLDADLVPPERAARCDAKLLDQISNVLGEHFDELRVLVVIKLAKALERNGRGEAAIALLTKQLAWAEESDEGRALPSSITSTVEKALGDACFRCKQWRPAFMHYGARRQSYDFVDHNERRDHLRCRCLLELGSYDIVIPIVTEHRQLRVDQVEFTDYLALAQLLSGKRDTALETLASARSDSSGHYTTELDTLERCWKALHDDPAKVELDVRTLTSVSLAGCSTLATELLVRGGAAAIEPNLSVFSSTDYSPPMQRLRNALMETGEACVNQKIQSEYDASHNAGFRERLDAMYGRFRNAAAVRAILEQR